MSPRTLASFRLVGPLAAAVALAGCPKATSTADSGLHVASPKWEEQIIYFVFTDRFANGDPTNDDQGAGEFGPSDKDKYSGGDLQGIIDHLDYIQGLGATAVWVTPPVANMWWDPLVKSGGYHGYWARHLKKVDEHLGTLATYQQLSRELHKRGMYLIQDVVPNHMGNFFTYTQCDDAGLSCGSKYPTACAADYTATGCDVSVGVLRNTHAVPTAAPEQAPFDQNDPTNPAHRAAGIYHWTPQIEDYGSDYQTHFWAISDLDDLNSESATVRQALRDSYGYWVKEVGVDGFRVDTARFVPHGFWKDFFYSTDPTAPGIMEVAKATGRDHFHAFGEDLVLSDPFANGGEVDLQKYYGTTSDPEFTGMLGYPLFGEISNVFAQGAPTAQMTYRLGAFLDPALSPAPYLTPTFIDNHDQSRFLAKSSGDALVEALAFLFTIPGIPTVYYGTEQGLAVTRQAMFDGGFGATQDSFNPNVGLYKILKALADLRKAHPALVTGDLTVLQDNPTGPGALVYRRVKGADTVLVFLNTSDSATLIANAPTGLPPGTVLETLASYPLGIDYPTPKVDAAGATTFSLRARGVIIAHATTQTETPATPGATITVTTPLEGQTFTTDTVISGTLSPATAGLKAVLNGDVSVAKAVTVASDGTWSLTLPVSTFKVGVSKFSLAFYSPSANVSSPIFHFSTNVVFAGRTLSVDDPAGDDHGLAGATYAYPGDASFTHQQDITNVTALVGATTLKLQVTMSALTNVWSPDLGFDHVVFDVFFQVPGQTGATALPFLQANAPTGFTWSYGQFTSGYKADNKMYNASGAGPMAFGAIVGQPVVTVSGKTVSFEYDRTQFNAPAISTWDGVKVYVTTWDYDGVQKLFRPITQAGAAYAYGHGAPTDPYIMDDVAPITLQYP